MAAMAEMMKDRVAGVSISMDVCTCPTEEELAAYAAGASAAEGAAAITAHVRECARCTRWLAIYRAIRMNARGSSQSIVEPFASPVMIFMLPVVS